MKNPIVSFPKRQVGSGLQLAGKAFVDHKKRKMGPQPPAEHLIRLCIRDVTASSSGNISALGRRVLVCENAH